MIEAEKRRDKMEKCMNEDIEDRSLTKELSSEMEERERKALTDLLTFQ